MVKLLTVFGATGQQGGALIHHILETPSLSSAFALRAITRDSSKPAAIALQEKGVEVVEADLNIRSTLDKSIAGSDIVFGVTNFWETGSADVEVSQGKAIADAAVAAGATQIIWSSLPSITKMTGGEYTGAKHFDSKAEVEEYIRSLNIKTMFFMPGWFMQNHLHMMRPQESIEGNYVFSQPWNPPTQLPLIDIRDAGKFIAPALLNPDLYHGRRFTCATAFYNVAEMADGWTKVTGKTVKVERAQDGVGYSALSEEQKLQFRKLKDLLTKYGYYGPTGKDDLVWTLEQVPEKLRTWEEFVRDNEPWFS